MRFIWLPVAALACVVVVVAACSDDDGGTPTVVPDAGADAQIDTGTIVAPDASNDDAGSDAGAQLAANGTACGTDNAKCASQFCVDGVCCEQACTGQCMSCNNTGMAGKCANVPRLQEDTSYVDDAGMPVDCTLAVGGAKCDGMGKCLRAVGIACNTGPQCLSGQCAAGTMKCLGATGELCSALGDCASNNCAVGVCQ